MVMIPTGTDVHLAWTPTLWYLKSILTMRCPQWIWGTSWAGR